MAGGAPGSGVLDPLAAPTVLRDLRPFLELAGRRCRGGRRRAVPRNVAPARRRASAARGRGAARASASAFGVAGCAAWRAARRRRRGVRSVISPIFCSRAAMVSRSSSPGRRGGGEGRGPQGGDPRGGPGRRYFQTVRSPQPVPRGKGGRRRPAWRCERGGPDRQGRRPAARGRGGRRSGSRCAGRPGSRVVGAVEERISPQRQSR